MKTPLNASTAPWAEIKATGPMFRPAQAANYYGVGLSTYYELIKSGDVPGFIKLSFRARASGVPKAWLDAAIAARVKDDD